MGITVLALNRKPLLNKLFFLMVATGFFYNLTIVLMWISPNYEAAYIWHKAGTMWPFFVALVLNFTLVYTQSKWIKNKLNYVLIYAPAIIFFLVSLATEEITAPPVLKYWGYNDLPGGTWLYFVSAVWTAVIPIVVFLLCMRYYLNAKGHAQKQSGKLVTVGFAIPIAAYILTNIIAPAINLDVPNMGIFSTLFSCVLVGYAIHKYELLEIDDALAAENVINTVPDALVLTDVNGNILRVNEKFINRSGYSQDELIGQSITKFCIENFEYTDVLEELKRDGSVKDQEIIVRVKSGEKRNVLLSGSIILSRQSKPIGLTCIIHDITERKSMEERLVKAERLASIGELAGQLGHDLRNPLAGIKNGVYLVKKKGNSITEEERGEILKIMEAAVEDSNRIVTSLIEYSGMMVLTPELTTPKRLVSNALAKLTFTSGVTLENNVVDETLTMLDAACMENVFLAILQNAVQATEKGTITIEANTTKAGIQVSVIDTGIGIPEDIQSKLFTPLVTTKAKGMGMSLAICKRVVEAHGGKIVVESQVGVGTTVTVTLPVVASRKEFADLQASLTAI
jgi:PAS domain S-box-containing protein